MKELHVYEIFKTSVKLLLKDLKTKKLNFGLGDSDIETKKSWKIKPTNNFPGKGQKLSRCKDKKTIQFFLIFLKISLIQSAILMIVN